jgi:hypothetical protein
MSTFAKIKHTCNASFFTAFHKFTQVIVIPSNHTSSIIQSLLVFTGTWRKIFTLEHYTYRRTKISRTIKDTCLCTAGQYSVCNFISARQCSGFVPLTNGSGCGSGSVTKSSVTFGMPKNQFFK